MRLYLMLSLSNTSTFCWLMRLFLSNPGSLMSYIVTTFCILRQPARVLTSLLPPSNFVITPFGKADLLIIETFKPESKSTQKSLRLLIVLIVSALQMITGVSCFGSWFKVCHPRPHSIHIQRLWIRCLQQRNRSCWILICPMWRELGLPLNSQCCHHIQRLSYDD